MLPGVSAHQPPARPEARPSTLGGLFFIAPRILLENTMSLKDQITEDMKTAMRAKDSERLGTIRLLLAACKQK